jgi:hypothetical protein
MNLYERYAVVQPSTASGEKTYNINHMPADIRREYAKDDYRPN